MENRNMMIEYLINDIHDTYKGRSEKLMEKRIREVKLLNDSELIKLYSIIKYLRNIGGEDYE